MKIIEFEWKGKEIKCFEFVPFKRKDSNNQTISHEQ